MKFRINYRGVFLYVVLLNLFVVFISQLSHLRRHSLPDEYIPCVLLIVNGLLLIFAFVNPLPRFIKIDRESRLVSYALLFHSRLIEINYAEIWSEYTTRSIGRGRTVQVLTVYSNDRKLFSASTEYFGWSEENLNSLHKLLSKQKEQKKPAS